MSETAISGVALSPEETSFFETGGESAIPTETGSDNTGGDSSVTSGGEGDGGTKTAGTDKAPVESKTVPLAALQEERTRRRAEQDAKRKLETELAELRGKFSIVDQLRKQPDGGEEKPAGPPAVEEDIFGNVKHVGETVAQLQKRLDEQDKAAKEAAERTTFVNKYRSDADAFQARNADYREAYSHLLSTRAQELIAIGYDDPKTLVDSGYAPTSPEVQAAAKALHDAIVADEFAIANLAFSKGKSPAEIIYGLAKQRGFKQAPAKPDEGKGAETLDRIERGQAAARSLNNAGGQAGEADMTAERLLAMPLKEFETYAAKNPAKVKRLMGG